jgi:hypothetical protein
MPTISGQSLDLARQLPRRASRPCEGGRGNICSWPRRVQYRSLCMRSGPGALDPATNRGSPRLAQQGEREMIGMDFISFFILWQGRRWLCRGMVRLASSGSLVGRVEPRRGVLHPGYSGLARTHRACNRPGEDLRGLSAAGGQGAANTVITTHVTPLENRKPSTGAPGPVAPVIHQRIHLTNGVRRPTPPRDRPLPS